jgi:Helix-turn-helix domain
VVPNRGAVPPSGEAQVTAESVPDIGRSLHQARTQAGLSLADAGMRIGLASSELEALESGTVGRMQDRVETLRALRAYANSLGLPGDVYVLTLVDLWPSLDVGARNGDTGVVPVVSVSAAPAGGHSPAAAYGSAFTGDGTSANEAMITGVVGAVSPSSINDTRPVPIFETGQVSAVRQGPPRYLKVLVTLVALLVVVAVVGLGLHNQISGWIHSARTETSSLINKAKHDAGLKNAPATGKTKTAAVPKFTVSTNPDHAGGTVTVGAPSFYVQVATNANPSWVQVTDSGSQAPIFSQVLQGGQSKLFTVTDATTIETGSSAAHFVVLDGFRPLTTYTPTAAPFTMTFRTSSSTSPG